MAGGGAASGVMGLVGNILGDVAGSIGARERGRAIRRQGTELEIQADIEELNAKITENDLRDQLLRTLASNTAAAAASGIALESPSNVAAMADDSAQGNRAIKMRNLESLFKTSAMRRQARALFRQGKYAIITGKLNASAGALGGASSGFQGFGGGPSGSSGSSIGGGYEAGPSYA